MAEDMVSIPYDEFYEAAKNWDTLTGANYPYVTYSNGLDIFLGWDILNMSQWMSNTSPPYTQVLVPARVAHKLRMLAGPHAFAIYKAYLARQEKDK